MGISAFGASGIKPGVCTSTTRPSAPYEGMVIYETDTDKTYVYTGSTWTLLTPTGTMFNYTAGTSLVAANLSIDNNNRTMGQIDITPTSTSDKVIIFANYNLSIYGAMDSNWYTTHTIVRNSTTVLTENLYQTLYEQGNYNLVEATSYLMPYSSVYVDSPSTTSAVTYYVKCNAPYGGTTVIASTAGPSPRIYAFLIKG